MFFFRVSASNNKQQILLLIKMRALKLKNRWEAHLPSWGNALYSELAHQEKQRRVYLKGKSVCCISMCSWNNLYFLSLAPLFLCFVNKFFPYPTGLRRYVLLFSSLQSIQIMIITLKRLITLTKSASSLHPKQTFKFSTGFNAKIDYFKVLDVDKSATVQQIKAAFLTKAKQFHPDVNPKFQDRFKMINQAYKILTDENIRRQYERIRQSVADSEEETQIFDENAKQKQRDPVSKQIQRNLNYLKLLKKQALNAHIASQYNKKSSKEKIQLREKEKKKNLWSENLVKILVGLSAVLSVLLVIEMGLKEYNQKQKQEKQT